MMSASPSPSARSSAQLYSLRPSDRVRTRSTRERTLHPIPPPRLLSLLSDVRDARRGQLKRDDRAFGGVSHVPRLASGGVWSSVGGRGATVGGEGREVSVGVGLGRRVGDAKVRGLGDRVGRVVEQSHERVL